MGKVVFEMLFFPGYKELELIFLDFRNTNNKI